MPYETLTKKIEYFFTFNLKKWLNSMHNFSCLLANAVHSQLKALKLEDKIGTFFTKNSPTFT